MNAFCSPPSRQARIEQLDSSGAGRSGAGRSKRKQEGNETGVLASCTCRRHTPSRSISRAFRRPSRLLLRRREARCAVAPVDEHTSHGEQANRADRASDRRDDASACCRRVGCAPCPAALLLHSNAWGLQIVGRVAAAGASGRGLGGSVRFGANGGAAGGGEGALSSLVLPAVALV